MSRKLKFLLIGILIIILVILSNALGFEDYSSLFELSIVPIIAIIYLFKAKVKPISFTLFMVLYALGDLIWVTGIEAIFSFFYYITNGLYILGYIFLLVEIYKNINFKKIITMHRFELIVLISLFLYMMYVLIKIIKPITQVSNYSLSVQIIELIYNTILLLLLNSSVLYYIQNTSKKNFIFLFGCGLLVFSELLLIGYYYMKQDLILSYASTVLYISGFLFLYYQTQMKIESRSYVSTE